MTHAPTPETPADRARALHERRIAMLGQLAEAGLEMALDLRDRTRGNVDERAYLDFTRISRAVRLTLMLQAKLAQDMEDRDRQAAARAGSDRRSRTYDRKERVARIVERIAEQDDDDPDDAERLAFEIAERLDREELYGDVLDRPVSELVALICQDLGLDPDWSRLAQDAWAKAEIETGAPGWPLAGSNPAAPPSPVLPGLGPRTPLSATRPDETAKVDTG